MSESMFQGRTWIRKNSVVKVSEPITAKVWEDNNGIQLPFNDGWKTIAVDEANDLVSVWGIIGNLVSDSTVRPRRPIEAIITKIGY